MQGIDPQKARREHIRWLLLLALNYARPEGTVESVLLSTLQAVYPDCTSREIRTELHYLCDRDLVEVEKRPAGIWHAGLTRHGVDIVEYTVACDAGIARPEKYWA